MSSVNRYICHVRPNARAHAQVHAHAHAYDICAHCLDPELTLRDCQAQPHQFDYFQWLCGKTAVMLIQFHHDVCWLTKELHGNAWQFVWPLANFTIRLACALIRITDSQSIMTSVIKGQIVQGWHSNLHDCTKCEIAVALINATACIWTLAEGSCMTYRSTARAGMQHMQALQLLQHLSPHKAF